MRTPLTTKANTHRNKAGPGRRSDLQRGLELLKLRHSPLDLCDHPLAKSSELERLAKERHGTNPFGVGIELRKAILDALLACENSLMEIPGQERLRVFIKGIREGLGTGAAAEQAGTSREWGSRRLVKIAALMVIRNLEARFQ